MTATTYRANAEGRDAWMTDVFAPINAWHRGGHREQAPMEMVDEALARIAAEGEQLGRTAQWKSACRFFAHELETVSNTEDHRRWTLLQGSVWLGYANI
jgi:hypothetical protein